MSTFATQRRLHLAEHSASILEHAAGTVVVCRAGCVWLTQYGDHRDFILHAGERFRVDGPGCVVMSARRGAELEFLAPDAQSPRATPAPGLAGLLRRLLAPRWHSAARRLAGGAAAEC